MSLEFAHISGVREDLAIEEIRREGFFARTLTQVLQSQGLTVSTCVLIDDSPSSMILPERQRELVRELAGEFDVEVDYFESQSALAATLGTLDPYFYPEIPQDSAGFLGTPKNVPTVDPVVANERWLENGEPGRDHPAPEPLRLPVRRSEDHEEAASEPKGAGSRRTRQHAIHLDVELWSQPRRRGLPGGILWSLPMLAAWWQLLRLGARVENDGNLVGLQSDHDAAPPFNARTTLTILQPDFLAVEHAVRTVLGRVAVPDGWLAPAVGGAQVSPLEHLDRISYVFAGALPLTR